MRADLYLAENGHVPSRQRAKTLIEGGHVTVDGRVLKKPAEDIPAGEHTVSVRDPLRYVGRGGLKLEAALDAFGVDPAGKIALDVGASTGGFTDCLLQHGAQKVYAVDAGEGQLAASLREDPRVCVREHLNARDMTLSDLEGVRVDLIVMDVSFISATYILPRFPLLLKEGGSVICLVKPQFEVGRELIGKGGVVKDPRAHLSAVTRVCEAASACGLLPQAILPSPITGGDGNREFLLLLQSSVDAQSPAMLDGQTILRAVYGNRATI